MMPLDIETIRSLRPGNDIHYFAKIDSTMTEAGRLAALGAPHATVVLAEEQTAGMGRLGRSWQSPAGIGIYCSILLRLPVLPNELPVASLLLALATAEAIHKSTDLACDLRWPNDILINERKVAGILTHLVETCVVAGIGINVNQTLLPADLRTPATSLRIESNGNVQPCEDLIVNLLEAIDTFCSMLVTQGSEAILRAFTSGSSYVTNRRVLIEENGASAVTAGLDQNGFLLVRFDSGQTERLATGGVRSHSQ